MRIIATPLYRAFPELDPFGDEACRSFVNAARASRVRRTIRAATRSALLLALVVVEVRVAAPMLLGHLPSFRAMVFEWAIVLFTLGIGWLVLRDIQLRLAVRRLLNRGARCPRCSYVVAGLPVSEAKTVTCPECARVTDVAAHASSFARGTDGLLRFLPSPDVVLPADSWWTPARRRLAFRSAAGTLAAVLLAVGALLALWELRLRDDAAAVAAVAGEVPPADRLVLALNGPLAGIEGTDGIDAVLDFEARHRDRLAEVLKPIEGRYPVTDPHRPSYWDNSGTSTSQPSAETTALAREAGMLDDLRRIGSAPALRIDPAVQDGARLPWPSPKWLSHAATNGARVVATAWLAAAAERRNGRETADALDALSVIDSADHALSLYAGGFGGEAFVPVMTSIARGMQGLDGEHVVRAVERAIDRLERKGPPAEAIVDIAVARFRIQLCDAFRHPARRRWAWIATLRGPAPPQGRIAALAYVVSSTLQPFEPEWQASGTVVPAVVRDWLSGKPMRTVIAGIPPGTPPMARRFAQQFGLVWPSIAMSHMSRSCLATMLAIERFRRANGRLPDALSQLVPAHLPAVPGDALTGAPFLYVRDGTAGDGNPGYRLGSAGMDGIDDSKGSGAGDDYLLVDAPSSAAPSGSAPAP